MADPKYLEFLSTASPETLHEMVVENRLGDLREQCWALKLQPGREDHRTGQRIAPKQPFYCGCNAELQPGATVLVDAEGEFYCDGCFERLHRPQVEEELAKDTGGDW
jgi:hypothetical protein